MRARIALFVFLMAVTAGMMYAQPNRKGIEWMLKEKIKINPEMAIRQAAIDASAEKGDGAKGSLEYTDKPIVSSANIDAEVHAAVNPTDTLNLLASPIRQGGFTLSTPIYYTKNFGGTWTKSAFNPMPAAAGALSVGGGDPVLAFDENGRAYFSWLELQIKNMSTDTIYWGLYWAYSDDGGVTWIRPAGSAVAFSKVVNATGTSDKPVTDKQWMAVDRSNTIWRNNLYMSYVQIDLQNGSYQIVVHAKPADSLNFNPAPVPVTDSTFTLCQFASLDVDIYGHVHVVFFGTKDNIEYGIYHSSSVDGGQTFSTPALVSEMQMPRFSAGQLNETVSGISDGRLYPACYVAASRTTPHIYATWTANGVTSKLNNGLDIYFSASSDGGASWSPAKVVNDDQSTFPAHQYYSSISCGPDGNVILGWYDRRDDSANIVAHYNFSESFDYGSTFSPAYQVTTTGTDFSKVGLSNNDFGIGEYTQVLGLKDYIIPVWTDGRTNNGNLNIYVAFVNRKTMSIEQFGGVNRNLGVSSVFPNPSPNIFNVAFSLTEPSRLELYLFDQAGRLVHEGNPTDYPAGEHTVKLDASSFGTGTYFLMLKVGMENFAKQIVVRQ
ncbi:MAG: T9SS type A sorting domain-containing protein [Bacteroidales bacterium]